MEAAEVFYMFLGGLIGFLVGIVSTCAAVCWAFFPKDWP